MALSESLCVSVEVVQARQEPLLGIYPYCEPNQLGNFSENCPFFCEMGTMIPTSRSDWGLNEMLYAKC